MRERFRSKRFGNAVRIGVLGALACFGGEPARARPARRPPPASVRSLPDRAFRVEWEPIHASPFWKPGQVELLAVTFTNLSDVTWPDRKSAAGQPPGSYSVRLSCRWINTAGGAIPPFVDRFDLKKPLAPGQSATLPVRVTAPKAPGSYQIQFDLVQELVAWFADKGAKQLRFPVRVEP